MLPGGNYELRQTFPQVPLHGGPGTLRLSLSPPSLSLQTGDVEEAFSREEEELRLESASKY